MEGKYTPSRAVVFSYTFMEQIMTLSILFRSFYKSEGQTKVIWNNSTHKLIFIVTWKLHLLIFRMLEIYKPKLDTFIIKSSRFFKSFVKMECF